MAAHVPTSLSLKSASGHTMIPEVKDLPRNYTVGRYDGRIRPSRVHLDHSVPGRGETREIPPHTLATSSMPQHTSTFSGSRDGRYPPQEIPEAQGSTYLAAHTVYSPIFRSHSGCSKRGASESINPLDRAHIAAGGSQSPSFRYGNEHRGTRIRQARSAQPTTKWNRRHGEHQLGNQTTARVAQSFDGSIHLSGRVVAKLETLGDKMVGVIDKTIIRTPFEELGSAESKRLRYLPQLFLDLSDDLEFMRSEEFRKIEHFSRHRSSGGTSNGMYWDPETKFIVTGPGPYPRSFGYLPPAEFWIELDSQEVPESVIHRMDFFRDQMTRNLSPAPRRPPGFDQEIGLTDEDHQHLAPQPPNSPTDPPHHTRHEHDRRQMVSHGNHEHPLLPRSLEGMQGHSAVELGFRSSNLQDQNARRERRSGRFTRSLDGKNGLTRSAVGARTSPVAMKDGGTSGVSRVAAKKNGHWATYVDIEYRSEPWENETRKGKEKTLVGSDSSALEENESTGPKRERIRLIRVPSSFHPWRQPVHNDDEQSSAVGCVSYSESHNFDFATEPVQWRHIANLRGGKGTPSPTSSITSSSPCTPALPAADPPNGARNDILWNIPAYWHGGSLTSESGKPCVKDEKYTVSAVLREGDNECECMTSSALERDIVDGQIRSEVMLEKYFGDSPTEAFVSKDLPHQGQFDLPHPIYKEGIPPHHSSILAERMKSLFKYADTADQVDARLRACKSVAKGSQKEAHDGIPGGVSDSNDSDPAGRSVLACVDLLQLLQETHLHVQSKIKALRVGEKRTLLQATQSRNPDLLKYLDFLTLWQSMYNNGKNLETERGIVIEGEATRMHDEACKDGR